MWFTKHSIKLQNGAHRRHSEGKPRRIDRRLENLLYRKSKLESVAETSAVISGFAIVALVEFSIDSYPNIPSRDGVFTAYAIVSCLLVSVHLLALLMSMCILPEITSVLHQKAQWAKHKSEEPLSTVNVYVEVAWVLSTGFGLFLIIVEVGLVFWIKVAGFSRATAYAAIAALFLIGSLFIIFAVGFYIRIIRKKHLWNKSDSESIERHAVAAVVFMNSISTEPSVMNVNERLSK